MISQIFLFGGFEVQLKDMSIEITQDDGCKLCLILEGRDELAEFITTLSSAIRPSTEPADEFTFRETTPVGAQHVRGEHFDN